MDEIQFQKRNTNTFAYVSMVSGAGMLFFKGKIYEYNPETEENENERKFCYELDEFSTWLKEGWIVA